jgi:hypothetical protein
MLDDHAAADEVQSLKVKTLMPIVGAWEIEGGHAKFVGSGDDAFKIGAVVGDVRAINGNIRAKIVLGDVEEGAEGRILFGFDAATGHGFSAGLGGYGRAFVLDIVSLGIGAKMIHGLGRQGNLKSGKPYTLQVNLRGVNVQLYVDNVKVLEHTLPHALIGDQIGAVAFGTAQTSFADFEVVPFKPRVFVVMQFSEPYNSLYEEVIRPVAKSLGLEAYRADDVFRPGIVLQDIVKGISTSQVVVAEVTPRNPNVYYELGYAHAVGTPTILLAEQPSEGSSSLPFDISGFRCIFYDDAIRGKRKVEAALEKHLRNILERSSEPIASNGHS